MAKADNQFFRIILPAMFGFFIMGFVDLVGISTSYVKAELGMGDTVLSLISVSCYIWFLLLSIPTGFLMNRFGRKNVVLASFAVNIVAMLIPVIIGNTFAGYLVAFAFLGIGNTLLQVAMNPLVSEVVSPDKLTGTLTLGQFVKAISSFLAPLIAAACAASAFGWMLIFPIFAAVSMIAAIWLWLSPVKNEPSADPGSISFGRTFSLLKDRTVLLFFVAILILVGADVGMNVSFPKLLSDRFAFDVSKAGMGNSAYFLSRTVGAFCGGLILLKINEKKFYVASIIIALAGLAGLILAVNPLMAIASVAVFGLGYANLFSIIFSLALKHVPDMSNEVSSLLVTGIAGGAVVTPLLGAVTDIAGTQTSAIIALAVIWLYMFAIIGVVKSVASRTAKTE